jgi:hypothetical protein
MSGEGNTVIRAGLSLAVYLVFVALLVGLAWIFSNDFDDASRVVRGQFEDSPDPTAAVQGLLDAARLKLIGWISGAMGTSWIASVFFLFKAQGSKPRDLTEAREQTGTWVIMLVVSLALCALIWFLQVSNAEVGAILLTNNYITIVALTFVGVLLAYWVATALAVKWEMRFSVPLSGLIRKKWN